MWPSLFTRPSHDLPRLDLTSSVSRWRWRGWEEADWRRWTCCVRWPPSPRSTASRRHRACAGWLHTEAAAQSCWSRPTPGVRCSSGSARRRWSRRRGRSQRPCVCLGLWTGGGVASVIGLRLFELLRLKYHCLFMSYSKLYVSSSSSYSSLTPFKDVIYMSYLFNTQFSFKQLR